MSAHSVVNEPITEIRKAEAGLAGRAVLPLGIGLVILAVMAFIGLAGDEVMRARFWHAYLLAVVYCTSIGLGGLFFVIAHHLTGGRWGTPIRRLAELTAGTIWLGAIGFLPILVLVNTGHTDLYPWVDRLLVESDPILSGKADYLSPMWFTIRTVAYFAIWLVMVRIFKGLSLKQDTTEPLKSAKRMQLWSGPCMLLLALTLNFTAFDWLMSLEPHWFSTMFGVYFFSGSFGAFLAFAIYLSNRLQDNGVLTQSITTEQYHDLGKLMFAFIFFWGYIAFSQYMLIWYAAIPEETMWYDVRQQGMWLNWSLLLLFGHLFIPFLGTMSSAVRRNRKWIGAWAVWMLVMHWVDQFYIIMPQAQLGRSVDPTCLPAPWMEIGCVVGMALLFKAAALWGAAGKNLLPLQDPRMPIALTYHNH
ncbi:hypothetical protein Mal64_23500 [Pseudobythopirellula maris]|uniref:Quinol:cytochrome C oxidoreductase n=1 Tax=Pseudobythopirellula maris TaxID=2527991 RepID=A0A5C5ZN08_9BACT|nr:quinol:cytochrome C oxidoreductase [Pseudobythopirellula maris]TWT88862.1 hypothetical protein Mal64_23500 [Pseudobythopirellula maris]